MFRYHEFGATTAAGEALIRHGSEKLVRRLYDWASVSPQRLSPLADIAEQRGEHVLAMEQLDAAGDLY